MLYMKTCYSLKSSWILTVFIVLLLGSKCPTTPMPKKCLCGQYVLIILICVLLKYIPQDVSN